MTPHRGAPCAQASAPMPGYRRHALMYGTISGFLESSAYERYPYISQFPNDTNCDKIDIWLAPLIREEKRKGILEQKWNKKWIYLNIIYFTIKRVHRSFMMTLALRRARRGALNITLQGSSRLIFPTVLTLTSYADFPISTRQQHKR